MTFINASEVHLHLTTARGGYDLPWNGRLEIADEECATVLVQATEHKKQTVHTTVRRVHGSRLWDRVTHIPMAAVLHPRGQEPIELRVGVDSLFTFAGLLRCLRISLPRRQGRAESRFMQAAAKRQVLWSIGLTLLMLAFFAAVALTLPASFSIEVVEKKPLAALPVASAALLLPAFYGWKAIVYAKAPIHSPIPRKEDPA